VYFVTKTARYILECAVRALLESADISRLFRRPLFFLNRLSVVQKYLFVGENGVL